MAEGGKNQEIQQNRQTFRNILLEKGKSWSESVQKPIKYLLVKKEDDFINQQISILTQNEQAEKSFFSTEMKQFLLYEFDY